jgi:DNA gyrase subunit A
MTEDGTILTVTDNGFGKKSSIDSYRLGSRGNMGVLNIRNNDRIGHVVGSVMVHEEDEIMLITQKGKIIRLPVNQVRSTGRVTQGVRLINLETDEQVVSIEKIIFDRTLAAVVLEDENGLSMDDESAPPEPPVLF